MKKYFLLVPFFSIAFLSCFSQSPAAGDLLLDFIIKNKTRSSLFLLKNDTVVAVLNENKMMPLASTVKIMIAIEFAKQAARNIFNKDAYISLKELDKYYLANTDGGAHPAWLIHENEQLHIRNDSIKLIDVARGMIIFSSNANTEFLMDLLGFDNVKNNIQLLGIKQHSSIYPIVASLFMYQNPRNKKEENILKEIKKLTDQEYSRYIFDMHNALKYDTVLKSKFRPQDLSMKMQKVWSDRLPVSTTKEYARIGSILNNRKYFDTNTYSILSNILETLMENPANKKILRHAGMKGGSTMWVLTRSLYATLMDGTRIEMAYFFNDLTNVENIQLQKWMNNFELEVLTNPLFRKNISTRIRD